MPQCPPQHSEFLEWFEDWPLSEKNPAAIGLDADSPPRKIEAFAYWTATYEAVKFQIALKKL